MKSVALMEDSQKQFIAWSYKAVAGVEGWNSFVQPMQEAQTQMLDMSYSAMRTASSQMKAMTDDLARSVVDSQKNLLRFFCFYLPCLHPHSSLATFFQLQQCFPKLEASAELNSCNYQLNLRN
jgi:hypothetical protein